MAVGSISRPTNLGNIGRVFNPYPLPILYPRIPNIGVPSYRPPGVQVGRNIQLNIHLPKMRPESYYTEWMKRTMGPTMWFPNYPVNPIGLQIPFSNYNQLPSVNVPSVNVPSYPYPQIPTGQLPTGRNLLQPYPYPRIGQMPTRPAIPTIRYPYPQIGQVPGQYNTSYYPQIGRQYPHPFRYPEESTTFYANTG